MCSNQAFRTKTQAYPLLSVARKGGVFLSFGVRFSPRSLFAALLVGLLSSPAWAIEPPRLEIDPFLDLWPTSATQLTLTWTEADLGEIEALAFDFPGSVDIRMDGGRQSLVTQLEIKTPRDGHADLVQAYRQELRTLITREDRNLKATFPTRECDALRDNRGQVAAVRAGVCLGRLQIILPLHPPLSMVLSWKWDARIRGVDFKSLELKLALGSGATLDGVGGKVSITPVSDGVTPANSSVRINGKPVDRYPYEATLFARELP